MPGTAWDEMTCLFPNFTLCNGCNYLSTLGSKPCKEDDSLIWDKLKFTHKAWSGVRFASLLSQTHVHSTLVMQGCVIYHVVCDHLIHCGQDTMAASFLKTFSNAFSWMKMHEFRLRFHWSLFLRLDLILLHHWLRSTGQEFYWNFLEKEYWLLNNNLIDLCSPRCQIKHQSTLVRVIAWYIQATNHYLN